MTYPAPLVLASLLLIVTLSEFLVRKGWLKQLGTALLSILIAAVAANLELIPSASDQYPLYNEIFKYLAPLSIFYLLLGVNLKSIKKAGAPMIIYFIVGATGTTLGVIIAMTVIDGSSIFGENYSALAGMFAGTYIGGSVNFNAVAIHYDMMTQGNIYAGAVAVDNILTAIWMIVTLLLPRLFLKREIKVDKVIENEPVTKDTAGNLFNLVLLGALGLIMMLISDFLEEWLESFNISIPSILILTTIALLLAQVNYIHKLKESHLLGLISMYLFLAVIGAYCEIAALQEVGHLALWLLVFVIIIMLVHGLTVYGFCFFYNKDWEMASIASQSNIGGASTAMALAESFKRSNLILPAILIGSLGAGLGTYIGFLVVAILK